MRRPTILAVEDDADIRELFADVLSGNAYRVVVAPNHTEALIIPATLRFALVLTDAEERGPGDASHWAGLERLCAAAHPEPVAICSGRPTEDFDGFSECGFAALLPKPFDVLELLASVRQLATTRVPE